MGGMPARLVVTRAGLPDRRVPLYEGAPLVVGRGMDAGVSVPDEEALSRRHAVVRLQAGAVRVERLPEAQGPVYVDGVAKDAFELAAGGQFLIGRTRFTFETG